VARLKKKGKLIVWIWLQWTDVMVKACFLPPCGNPPKEPPTCYATDTNATPLWTVTEVTTHPR
jgi:hypothetical protein